MLSMVVVMMIMSGGRSRRLCLQVSLWVQLQPVLQLSQ